MAFTPAQRAAYSAEIRAYTRTDVWRLRAARFRRTHGNFCDACGGRAGARNVDVHHRSYRNAFHGREPDEDLRALCRPDHEVVHRMARAGWSLDDATDNVINALRVSVPRRALVWTAGAIIMGIAIIALALIILGRR